MRNTLQDLTNYMFEQLERLYDDELDDEDLDKEIKRSEAATKVGKMIVSSGELMLEARKHADEYAYGQTAKKSLPPMLDSREG